MRWTSVALSVVALANSSTLGGVVAFDPLVQEVDLSGDTRTTFEVSIASLDTMTSFNAFDIVLGSDNLEIVSWAWDSWSGLFDDPGYVCSPGPCPWPMGIYSSDLLVGWPLLGGQLVPPLLLGLLTVDATGLAMGQYTVMVDPGRDGGLSMVGLQGGAFEPLNGIGLVRVIPDPGTLTLLALATMGLGRVATAKRSPYCCIRRREGCGREQLV